MYRANSNTNSLRFITEPTKKANQLPRLNQFSTPKVFYDHSQWESDVQLIELAQDVYCLNHALRLEQIYGGIELRKAYHNLQNGNIVAIKRDLLEVLKLKRFIVPPGEFPDRENLRLMTLEDPKNYRKPSFTLLRILLTDICNLACSYCKVIPNIKMPIKNPISLSRLEEVMSFFFSNSEAERPKIIHITGGEPTIHFDYICSIITMITKLKRTNENLWVVLGTNATLINKDRADFLAKHDVKCIVSMDGTPEIHDKLRFNRARNGSWQLVHNGITKLKEAGVEVSISMVLGLHNMMQAHQIIEWFLDRYQPSGLGVNFMKPPVPEKKDYPYLIDPTLYADTVYDIHKAFRDQGLFLELVFRKLQPFVKQQYRYHDCGAAGGTNLNVDAKGKVGPCKSFLVMNRLALNQLDAREYKSKVIEKWRRRSPIYYSACSGCSARGMCGNGCAYEAAIYSGNEMDICIRSCEYTKRFNRLFIEDLFDQIKPRGPLDKSWFKVPSKNKRERLLGNVQARPNTLCYSIGHQTMD